MRQLDPDVEPVPGEELSFRVASSTAGRDPYLVDMKCNGGLGQCDCTDWKVRRRPNVEHGNDDPCKHIQRVRRYISDVVILRSLEAEPRDDTGP